MNRRDVMIRRHVSNGAAANDPDDVMFFVLLDAHHHIRRQAVLHVDIFDARIINDVDAPAVAAQHDFSVQPFRDGEAFCV